MVTRAKFLKLGARLEELASVLNPDDSVVRVVVFEGETADFALSWHRRQRPEHAGRRVQLEYRREARQLANDLFALHVATAAEMDELLRWLNRRSAGSRNFVPPDEAREEADEGRDECAAWQQEYAAALAEAGLAQQSAACREL